MSERKSAEIKFRCTPTFKAAAQTAADASGQSLTEYIEAAVWAQQTPDPPEAAVHDALEHAREVVALGGWSVPPFQPWNTPSPELLVSLAEVSAEIAAMPGEDSGAKDDATAEVPATTCTCRPWEFCTHKVGA